MKRNITYTTKACEICHEDFQPKGPASRFCSICARKRHLEAATRHNNTYRAKHGSLVGVGKGGASKKGPEHQSWKNGISVFFSEGKRLKSEVNRCMRCHKPLEDAKPSEWACHHKDHDRSNNIPENFELLCKRCHQIEHDCVKAVQGATTKVIRLANGRYARDTSSSQEGAKRVGSEISEHDIV